MTDPERFDVPVNGGELAVYRWPGEGPIVLAAHGLTSNAYSWGVVADALGGDVTLIAPDLRGRGRSNGLPGPFGIAQHADDLAMVLDAIGAEQVVVAGHSMGGFIASMFAVRHAARARELVLVDGGPPFQAPPGDDDRRAAEHVPRPVDGAPGDDVREPRGVHALLGAAPVVPGPAAAAGRRAGAARPRRASRRSCAPPATQAAIREDGAELTASEYVRSASTRSAAR